MVIVGSLLIAGTFSAGNFVFALQTLDLKALGTRKLLAVNKKILY